MNHRPRCLVALGLALAFASPSCGSNSEASSDSSPSSTTSSSVPEEWCALSVKAAALPDLLQEPPTDANIERLVATARAYREMIETAPEAIADAFAVLDVSDPDSVRISEQEAFDEADLKIQEYVADECDVELGSVRAYTETGES